MLLCFNEAESVKNTTPGPLWRNTCCVTQAGFFLFTVVSFPSQTCCRYVMFFSPLYFLLLALLSFSALICRFSWDVLSFFVSSTTYKELTLTSMHNEDIMMHLLVIEFTDLVTEMGKKKQSFWVTITIWQQNFKLELSRNISTLIVYLRLPVNISFFLVVIWWINSVPCMVLEPCPGGCGCVESAGWCRG